VISSTSTQTPAFLSENPERAIDLGSLLQRQSAQSVSFVDLYETALSISSQDDQYIRTPMISGAETVNSLMEWMTTLTHQNPILSAGEGFFDPGYYGGNLYVGAHLPCAEQRGLFDASVEETFDLLGEILIRAHEEGHPELTALRLQYASAVRNYQDSTRRMNAGVVERIREANELRPEMNRLNRRILSLGKDLDLDALLSGFSGSLASSLRREFNTWIGGLSDQFSVLRYDTPSSPIPRVSGEFSDQAALEAAVSAWIERAKLHDPALSPEIATELSRRVSELGWISESAAEAEQWSADLARYRALSEQASGLNPRIRLELTPLQEARDQVVQAGLSYRNALVSARRDTGLVSEACQELRL
jgi:hypothetical protein